MEDFLSVLNTCKICRIGTADDAGMMIVPMNFGYEVSGEDVMLYFHTGLEGRKLRALRKDPRVCFEVDDKGMIAGITAAIGYVIEFQNYEGEIPFKPYKGNIRELSARNF